MMNFFYEKYPLEIVVNEEKYPILTDFRDYIQLLDMLKDDALTLDERVLILREYFLCDVNLTKDVIEGLISFINMDGVLNQEYVHEHGEDVDVCPKAVFSYSIDYPYILSAFMRDYGIDLENIEYMHWWKFRMLFDGLSEDTEIKKRIMYRSINVSEIKDSEERRRVARIQDAIRLPEARITDFDIGNAFM